MVHFARNRSAFKDLERLGSRLGAGETPPQPDLFGGVDPAKSGQTVV